MHFEINGVSDGIRHLPEPVARDLGFHHLICTDLMTGKDGLLTGRPPGPVCSGRHKERAVRELSPMPGIDLARSYAYGDRHSDISMLAMAGNAHPVESTRRLRKTPAERGRPVPHHRRPKNPVSPTGS